MNGGETIINRIKADCDESVASIRLDAEKANAAVLTEAEREAQLREKEIADKTQQRLRQIQAASKSRAELEVRNALLRRRRSEIDKTVGMLIDYLLQLGDNDYFNALPSDFEAKIREAGLDATVSRNPADIPGGFILKSGDIEENMDFEAILRARRDEIEDLINRGLFEQ